MKNILIILVCLVVFKNSSFSFNGYSLIFWNNLNVFKTTKRQIIDFENLAYKYIDLNDFEKALQYANRGLELSVKINSYENISNFYTVLGKVCFFSNLWDSALLYYNKSLNTANHIHNEEYIARAYINIAFLKYNQGQLKEAIKYCTLALKINTEIANKKGIAYSYNCFGHTYNQLGEFRIALDYIFKSIKTGNELLDNALQFDNYVYLASIYSNIGKYDSSFYYLNKASKYSKENIRESDIAYSYYILGTLYSSCGNYSKALEYQIKALEIHEKVKFKRGIAIGYSEIGKILEMKGDYGNAIKYHIKCLALAKEIGGIYGVVHSNNNLGYNYYKLKKYETAKKYFTANLDMLKNLNMPTEIAATYNNLALIFFEQNNYKKALTYHSESLNIYKTSCYIQGIFQTYFNLATYYQNLTDHKKAIDYLNMSLKINEKVKDITELKRVLLALSENYSKLSLYKPAYEYFKKYQDVNDSLQSENETKHITQLEMQYEFDKRQKEQEFVQQHKEQTLQAKIKNQKIITFSAISLVSSLFILSLLAFRNYRLKQKNIKKDIELRQVEAEKKHEVDQMKLHFFANASHDIRTPLTLISGPLNELIDLKEVPLQMQKNLELIQRNTNLLHRFIDQILDFQKLDSKVINLILSKSDLIHFTKTITESFVFYIKSKNCTLDFLTEYKELIVWFDSEKLEKILYNLILNAIKFTPAHGSITIKIYADSYKAYIAVKDSGIGIPPEHIDLIFERYYQVEKTKAFYKGGSGIGLAHTKELVKIHQGDITVKSTEMEGSEFIVILPLNKDFYNDKEVIFQTEDNILADKTFRKADTSGMITAIKEKNIQQIQFNEPVEQEKKTDQPSVLIVEDDPDMHQYIVSCLQQHFKIHRAYNGTEGFNLAIKENPDVIISDVMMEQMDGIELCNKIKSELQVCHIPVILLTALASIENQIIGFATGADDYITKPFDAKLLKVRVQNIIQSRKILREVFSKTLIIEPQKITINSLDEEFLKKAINIVENNISDTTFNVDLLCEKMHISRSVFYRKIKSLTNEASNDFIKSLRLKRAAQLLKESGFSVSEIAYEVGFTSRKYFSKCFREYFGKSPSEYVRKELPS